MRRIFLFTLIFWTSACQPLKPPVPTLTATQPAPPTPTITPFQATVYLTPTLGYPPGGFGPTDFPPDINPLTGLSTDPALLDRRPIIIKVSNLPRNVRPQFGLSKADIVFEYYIEEGTTRFAAIFYSQDAEKVGSIRSARFFDEHLIRMYQGIFVFGSGDERVRDRLYNAEFANRLILEWQAGCPAMCRPDPLTNFLIANTAAVRAYAAKAGISDDRQNLDGMYFQVQIPQNGEIGSQVYVWYSGAIYNRWDFHDGKYFRFSDADNAIDGQPEIYEQLTDALTGEPITADNLVVLLMPHTFYSILPEIVEMQFAGSGPAYVFRDGQAYEARWTRKVDDAPLSLIDETGNPFPLKPGNTWFEVMGLGSKVIPTEQNWRFEMRFP